MEKIGKSGEKGKQAKKERGTECSQAAFLALYNIERVCVNVGGKEKNSSFYSDILTAAQIQ